jgi:hypothetical protein
VELRVTDASSSNHQIIKSSNHQIIKSSNHQIIKSSTLTTPSTAIQIASLPSSKHRFSPVLMLIDAQISYLGTCTGHTR